MTERIVPMIHVADVAATAHWYASIGFTIVDTFKEPDGGEVNWAQLRLGESTIMLNAGGQPSDAARRELDLYIYVDDVDSVRKRLEGKAAMVEDLHVTFYGMREFIIRDCNGFWIVFGQRSRR
ncbi:MAG: VOC family protein [Acidobacteria bacterium]|nr:VOC family protein [Acidobacteriota bacterium]